MQDVIVIGAGFAGLSAAHKFLELGVNDFMVLEARDRVGGRTMTREVGGLKVDFGGMWQGGSQTRLSELAAKYQISSYPTFLDGKAIFRVSGKQYEGMREDMDGLFNILEGVSYMLMRRKLGKLESRLDCDAPWNHPEANHLDAMTVEHWMQYNVIGEKLKNFIRLLCISLFCANADQISMLFFLHYIKSGDGLDVLVSAERDGAQHALFHGGIAQLAEKMASEMQERLLLSNPVTHIEWTPSCVTVYTQEGEYQAKRCVVAVPPTLLRKIEFSPTLPKGKQTLHDRLSMGSSIKFWVVYDKPFWRDAGYNGTVLRDDSPCSPVFDVTPAGQPKGAIAGFFDGSHAVEYGDVPMEDRRAIVLGMLAEHFGEEALAPVDYADHDWSSEEWSGGCYGAFAAPGVYARFGEWLRKPIGPFAWAGTETSPLWTGYIEGAIRSGERAAEEVSASL